MNIGNILVAKGVASVQDIDRAINHQKSTGGRLGDSLVALNILSREQIDEVLADAPQVPNTVAGTGIDNNGVVTQASLGDALAIADSPELDLVGLAGSTGLTW